MQRSQDIKIADKPLSNEDNYLGCAKNSAKFGRVIQRVNSAIQRLKNLEGSTKPWQYINFIYNFLLAVLFLLGFISPYKSRYIIGF